MTQIYASWTGKDRSGARGNKEERQGVSG
jgi:hypothetical protein